MCIFSSESIESHYRQGISTNEAPTTPSRDSSLSEEFGDQVLFWTPLNWPDDAVPLQYRATLLSVGVECYVYMANDTIEILGEVDAILMCNEIGEIFDTLIYPKGVELAGNPDGTIGDIDGDPRVTLFLGSFVRHMGQAYLGFFTPDHEIPGPYSNYREMVFVDGERPLNDTIVTTIHEFNHLIWFNHEMDEADFLTEGLANLAVDYTGYWSWVTDAVTTTFTDYPQISLLYFNRFYSSYWDASYGQAYLFVTYLWERFGVDFVQSLVAIPEDGALAIDVALSNSGYNLTFNDVYLDWITACVIDNPEIAGGIYGFASVDYTIDSHTSYGTNLPIEKNDVYHNLYGIHARKIHSPVDEFTFRIENPTSYALGISIAILDESGWVISQSLHTEYLEWIEVYCSGTNVQEVYVITSLMNIDTPEDYGQIYNLDEIPSVELDYNITEGIPQSNPELNMYIIPLSGVMILTIGAIVIYRMRSRNTRYHTMTIGLPFQGSRIIRGVKR
jgi:hypothetical protein